MEGVYYYAMCLLLTDIVGDVNTRFRKKVSIEDIIVVYNRLSEVCLSIDIVVDNNRVFRRCLLIDIVVGDTLIVEGVYR